MDTILFVCTGNTCRSPMAEAIAQHALDGGLLEDGERHLAASAGVAAGSGAPVTTETVVALAAMGIEADGRSKPLSAEMIRNARVVLCMTQGHARAARSLVTDAPDQEAKVLLLDPEGDVADPIGMGQDAYDALARHFRDLVPRRIREVLGHEDRAGIRSSRN